MPSFLKNRFKVASPLITAQTISPFSAAPCCFTITRSPSKMPAPDHAVAFDLQRKLFSTAHVIGNSQKPLDVFFAEKRLAGRHSTKHRHFSGSRQNRLAQRIGDLDGALTDPADVAFFLQRFQMIGDAVGRGYFELLADLVDRRRKAFLPNGLEQKIVDRFLPIGKW